MKALVFAAGLGTRLRPYTDNMPKALLELCGKPLIEHVLLKLKESGFTDVVINVHHFAQMIEDFIESKHCYGMTISFSDERNFLRDTGGGIKHASKLLNDGEPFLVHNVDILSNLNLNDFYKVQFCTTGTGTASLPLATLLVSDRETSRYLLFDNDNNLCAWINTKTKECKSPFKELIAEFNHATNIETVLDDYQLHKYAFAGIHTISPAIFSLMSECPDKFSIIDFYLSVADKYKIQPYISKDLKIMDVGKFAQLAEAEKFCKLL